MSKHMSRIVSERVGIPRAKGAEAGPIVGTCTACGRTVREAFVAKNARKQRLHMARTPKNTTFENGRKVGKPCGGLVKGGLRPDGGD